jgi:hypothetical protein
MAKENRRLKQMVADLTLDEHASECALNKVFGTAYRRTLVGHLCEPPYHIFFFPLWYYLSIVLAADLCLSSNRRDLKIYRIFSFWRRDLSYV